MFAVAWEEHGDNIIRGAAVLGALAVFGRMVVMPLIRFFRRIERSLVAVEQQLLTNNGGSTMKDKVEALMRHNGLDVPDQPKETQ